ncbi:MAG: hypothetical protein ACI88A_002017 [Paraglaciecola sp.]|jgi:hypothetical protein
MSAEFVKTLDKFKEFEPNFDQPEAYNLELAHYPNHDLQFALRYEHSKELEDQLGNRFGIGLRWLVYDHISIAVDYMQGDYKLLFLAPSEEDFEDEILEDTESAASPLRDEHIFAGQISIEF